MKNQVLLRKTGKVSVNATSDSSNDIQLPAASFE